MFQESKAYPFVFALVICAICSLLMAAVSHGLRERQEMNVDLEVKVNIFNALHLTPPLPKDVQPEEAIRIFHEKIEQVVINDKGDIVPGKTPEQIKEGETLYPLFIYREGGQVQGYCFPIHGKGLWSVVYGYLAIEPDGKTIRGITFYKHGETPGLGGEVEQKWFQKNFEGKKIWDEATQETVAVAVAKGRMVDRIPKEKWPHYVDGISGATLTGNGLNIFLQRWIKVYAPFFTKIHRS